MKLNGRKKTIQTQSNIFYIVNNSLIVTHFYFPCRCTFKNIFNIFFFLHSVIPRETVRQANPPRRPDQRHSAASGVTVCHCSRVTTSTAWPSSVTVFSMRVATGAMATWTGRLP